MKQPETAATFRTDVRIILQTVWDTVLSYFGVYLSTFKMLLTGGGFDFATPTENYKRAFSLFTQAMLLLLAFGGVIAQQPVQDNSGYTFITSDLINLILVFFWLIYITVFTLIAALISSASKRRYVTFLNPLSVCVTYCAVFIVCMVAALMILTGLDAGITAMGLDYVRDINLFGFTLTQIGNFIAGTAILVLWAIMVFTFVTNFAKAIYQPVFFGLCTGVVAFIISTLLFDGAFSAYEAITL